MKSKTSSFNENYCTPDIQNCHSRHAPSQPSVELCCSLALKMSLKQQYWTSQDETNHIKEAKTTWLFWEGQNKWNPYRSWLCPPRLKCPHGTHTPWGGGRNHQQVLVGRANESTWDLTVWRVEGAKACASHLQLVTTCVEQRRCLRIPSRCRNWLSHTQNGCKPGSPLEADAHNLPREKSSPPHSPIFSPAIWKNIMRSGVWVKCR